MVKELSIESGLLNTPLSAVSINKLNLLFSSYSQFTYK